MPHSQLDVNMEVFARSQASYSYAGRTWIIGLILNEGVNKLLHHSYVKKKITRVDKNSTNGYTTQKIIVYRLILFKGWEWFRDKETKESFQGALNHRVNNLRPTSQKKH